jgi:hypothetical protein
LKIFIHVSYQSWNPLKFNILLRFYIQASYQFLNLVFASNVHPTFQICSLSLEFCLKKKTARAFSHPPRQTKNKDEVECVDYLTNLHYFLKPKFHLELYPCKQTWRYSKSFNTRICNCQSLWCEKLCSIATWRDVCKEEILYYLSKYQRVPKCCGTFLESLFFHCMFQRWYCLEGIIWRSFIFPTLLLFECLNYPHI